MLMKKFLRYKKSNQELTNIYDEQPLQKDGFSDVSLDIDVPNDADTVYVLTDDSMDIHGYVFGGMSNWDTDALVDHLLSDKKIPEFVVDRLIELMHPFVPPLEIDGYSYVSFDDVSHVYTWLKIPVSSNDERD